MVPFTSLMIESWKNCGYKYLHILPFEKYGVLQPLPHDREVKRGYTIYIDEMELIQMPEDYFFTMEKYAMLHPMEAITVKA